MSTSRYNWLSDNPSLDGYKSCGNTRNKFINAVSLNQDGVNKLSNLLNNATVLDELKLLFNNPQDFLTSLIWYPFIIPYAVSDTQKYLKIGRISTKDLDGQYKVECNNVNFPIENNLVDLGKLYIPPKFNNFMDYEGFTSIDVYLPFVGYVNVLPSDVMGKWLYINLYVDYYTGQALYYLSVNSEDNADVRNRRIINKVSTQLGYNMPFGGTNALENSRNILLGTLSTSLKSFTNPMASMGLVDNLLSTTITPNIEKTNNTILDVASTKYVKVVIKRTTPIEIGEEYLRLYGKPLNEERILRNLQGFTKVSDVQLVSHIATQEELNELEQLLKEGVIF